MFKLTYWEANDSYYFHIGKRNLKYNSISRMAFTKVEGEEALGFLKLIQAQIAATKKGELIPVFEGSMHAATMDRSDDGFWDESMFCFKSIGLVIRVTFNRRTHSYLLHFLRPNRNLEKYRGWIGSTFTVTTPQIKDIINYMKKKMRV